MSVETNMREVVDRLRTEGSQALPELVEFNNALEAFVKNLKDIVVDFHDVHMALNVVGSGGDGNLNAIQDRTGRLDALMGQSLVAIEQLHIGVQSWDIAGSRKDSSVPRSGTPTN